MGEERIAIFLGIYIVMLFFYIYISYCMTKKSEKKAFPLWAKVVIGVCGLGIVSVGVLFSLKFMKEGRSSTPETSITGQQEQQPSDLSSNEPLNMNAEAAIKDYLTQANQDIKSDQVVASGATITVDYIGRLNDKEVFDTSVKSVAEAAGTYSPQRNYNEGLSFTVGAGQMIKGFDEAVVGMKVGETKTVHIPAEKAYGKRDENLILRVPLEQAGDTSGAQVGMKVLVSGQYPATIAEITDKEIVFDMNHELAGKDLIFDITIKALN